jgi:hypothetical protein
MSSLGKSNHPPSHDPSLPPPYPPASPQARRGRGQGSRAREAPWRAGRGSGGDPRPASGTRLASSRLPGCPPDRLQATYERRDRGFADAVASSLHLRRATCTMVAPAYRVLLVLVCVSSSYGVPQKPRCHESADLVRVPGASETSERRPRQRAPEEIPGLRQRVDELGRAQEETAGLQKRVKAPRHGRGGVRTPRESCW